MPGDAWQGYESPGFFDEMIAGDGRPHAAVAELAERIGALDRDELTARRAAAGLDIKSMGITFTVYSDAGMIDRAWPFDIVPRVIPASQWRRVAAGLAQRVAALNAFIADIYGEQRVIADGVFPREVLDQSVNFRPECVGMRPAGDIWAHICGSDLVRDHNGDFYVLEDNLRVPSGVSYMVENRMVAKRVFPELFDAHVIGPVDDYPSELLDALAALSPRPNITPNVALLTPGIYNSAFFEHVWLAGQMGAELVQGSDLYVGDDDCVYTRTIYGLRRVDVIYRRVDDLFLDPEVFRADSMLGTPGLMRAWRAGNVALANAPGAGVADDKVVYAFVPEFIRYYLGEAPTLANVPTWRCMIEAEREYVLAHLDELVVKPANESGGYGMLIGPRATDAEREHFAELIRANPRNYIAQPTLALSTAPTLIDEGLAPRHVDLRPFIVSRPDHPPYVTTGGLTRVALREGSLVVNSSQGGGSKDTWIIDDSHTTAEERV
ncbi:circularly permuted type 2 ATP-grasp protein [Salinisphaera sp. SPP-AMP-43]|uniref:circularly permuted type 2 ATP-grasp protein n=1 Tax=Salinisphaera sp. SPP-AMP-43 TaxID=3121288 RepID=UPI003C6E325D